MQAIIHQSVEWGLGLGREAHELSVGHMMIRAVLVYGAALLLVRLGHRRLMGRSSPFDFVLAIVLGSVLSRAITGQSPFLPTVAAGAVLVGMHWLLAVLAFHSRPASALVKGDSRTLVRDGQIQWDQMRRDHIGERDLMEALRLQGSVREVDEVELASLERSGDISVIPRNREARVIEVKVEQGVQTVRVEMNG